MYAIRMYSSTNCTILVGRITGCSLEFSKRHHLIPQHRRVPVRHVLRALLEYSSTVHATYAAAHILNLEFPGIGMM